MKWIYLENASGLFICKIFENPGKLWDYLSKEFPKLRISIIQKSDFSECWRLMGSV